MKSETGKWLLMLFKIALMLVSLYFIYNRVINKENSAAFIADTQIFTQLHSLYMLLILVVLMVINWFTEAIKWKYLIAKIYNLSIAAAWSAVLSGVTVSFFTPNRMGEFAGRILHLPQGIRLPATLLTFIGNTAQLLCTLVFGILAVMLCLPKFFELGAMPFLLVSATLASISVAMVFLYFRIGLLARIFQKYQWLHKLAEATSVFKAHTGRNLGMVLLLSALRYVIFASQFVLMLWLFDNTLHIAQMYMAVCIVFLMMTLLPTIAFSELAVRGSVAVSIIGLFGGNSLHILEASFLLWMLNLVLPAIAGSVTLLTLKFSKNN